MNTHHRLTVMRLSTFIIGAFIVLTFSRCGALNDLLGPPSGTFANVYQNTLGKTTCKSCHSPGGSGTVGGATIDFSTQSTAYTTLINAQVSGGLNSGTCGGINLVVAGNPSTSFLLGVLFSDYRINHFAGVSGCLPFNEHINSLNLSSSEKSSLVNWIQNGARNN